MCSRCARNKKKKTPETKSTSTMSNSTPHSEMKPKNLFAFPLRAIPGSVQHTSSLRMEKVVAWSSLERRQIRKPLASEHHDDGEDTSATLPHLFLAFDFTDMIIADNRGRRFPYFPQTECPRRSVSFHFRHVARISLAWLRMASKTDYRKGIVPRLHPKDCNQVFNARSLISCHCFLVRPRWLAAHWSLQLPVSAMWPGRQSVGVILRAESWWVFFNILPLKKQRISSRRWLVFE